MSSKELRNIANKIGATTITKDEYNKIMKSFTSKYGLKVKDPGYDKMLNSADSNVLVRADSILFDNKDVGVLGAGIKKGKMNVEMGMRDDFVVIVYDYDFELFSGGHNGVKTRFVFQDGKWDS